MRAVFDLDGTLANGKHREHFIVGTHRRWDAYFEACDGDAPITAPISVLHGLTHAGWDVEIWSGRGEGEGGSVRRKTLRWLWLHAQILVSGHLSDPTMQPDTMLSYAVVQRVRMRPHGDYTPDNELKLAWLREAHNANTVPDVVFDDRDKVVRMWRENNVPCFQVAPGDF